jgi:hypothetical protein
MLEIDATSRDAQLPAVNRLHIAADALGVGAHSDLLPIDVCHRLRLGQDVVFGEEANPTVGYQKLLDATANTLEGNRHLPLTNETTDASPDPSDVREITTVHYGQPWGRFSPRHYFGKATDLLRTRMARNDIAVSWCKDKRALDCGCGGGRYTVVLKNLGFAEIVSSDGSENALERATSRAMEASVEYLREGRCPRIAFR